MGIVRGRFKWWHRSIKWNKLVRRTDSFSGAAIGIWDMVASPNWWKCPASLWSSPCMGMGSHVANVEHNQWETAKNPLWRDNATSRSCPDWRASFRLDAKAVWKDGWDVIFKSASAAWSSCWMFQLLDICSEASSGDSNLGGWTIVMVLGGVVGGTRMGVWGFSLCLILTNSEISLAWLHAITKRASMSSLASVKEMVSVGGGGEMGFWGVSEE